MRTSFCPMLLIILMGTFGSIALTHAQSPAPLTGIWQGKWTIDPSVVPLFQKSGVPIIQEGRLSLDLTQRQVQNSQLLEGRDKPPISITGSLTFAGNPCFQTLNVSGYLLDRPGEFYLNLSTGEGVQMTVTGKAQGDTLIGNYQPWASYGSPCDSQRGTFSVSRVPPSPH